MANELRITSGSGNTIYAHIVSQSAQRWNGSAFEAYASGSYPNYTVALTEQGASGVYVGTFPAGITTSGAYEVYYYLQSGGSPSEGDPIAGIGSVNWSGAGVVSPALSGTIIGSYINAIRMASGSGNVLYANIMSPSARRWNGTSFESYSSGNYSNYVIALTEQGSSGIYTGNFPPTITDAAAYEVYIYLQAGGSPAEGDNVAGISTILWSGTGVISPSVSASGELPASDWAAYILRSFKRTDKSVELYDATNEAIAEIRRTIEAAREEKETTLTQQISVLGQYRMNVETDFGLSISDVLISDTSNSRYLIGISKAMFDWYYTRWGTSAQHRNKPIHWCLFGGQILVGPVPDTTAYIYKVSYSKDDHVLVTAATASVPFTTTDYREILKHGVLMRLYALVENDAQAQKYAAFWLNGLKQIEKKEDRNRRPVIVVGYNDF